MLAHPICLFRWWSCNSLHRSIWCWRWFWWGI